MKQTVFYAAGPGDVISTFGFWKQGIDDPNETSVAYSWMFFDVCRKMDLKAYVVSSHPRTEIVRDGPFTIEHRPRPVWSRRGVRYHFGRVLYALGLILLAWRVGAKVAVVADFHHWWTWGLGRLLGIEIVPTLHCTFWPTGFRSPSRFERIVGRLNAWFWYLVPKRTICISPEVQRQLGELAGRLPMERAVQARPHYRPDAFAHVQPPSSELDPFRILYAGRIEKNKGVFDLIEIAAQLKQQRSSRFVFELCGGGTDEQRLREQVIARHLGDEMLIHGKLDRSHMHQAFNRSHVVIVPTTAGFAEGLNKVAVESILAGRPCIASQVCPAVEILGDGVVEVAVGEIQAYVAAIQRLHDEPEEYARRRSACREAQAPFYDASVSWGGVLQSILEEILGPRSDKKQGSS